MTDAGATAGTDPLDRWARAAPLLILLYVAALAAVRIALSPWLEVDEAQFVGQTDLRLVYGNAHPPLYNWLVAGALRLTGDWAAAVALVRSALLAAFHLLVWDAARRLAGRRAALSALAASAFLPQIVWMAAVTQAHTTLAMVGMAGAAHAIVVIAAGRGRLWPFVWLGLAAAVAALAKFHALAALAGLAAGCALAPEMRRALPLRRLAWSGGVFALLAGPSLVAAALHPAASTGRLGKLYRGGGGLPDLPGIGLDGVLSMGLNILAWAGPAALVWLIARPPRAKAPPPGALAARRALGLSMAIGLAGFALVVLAADMTNVRERYLTPFLAVFPIWLAAGRPLRRRWPLGLAAALYLAVLPGMVGMGLTGGHWWSRPYAAIARALPAEALSGGPVVVSNRHAEAANLSLALGAEVAETEDAPAGRPLLLFWRGDGPIPESLARLAGERATDAPIRLRLPMRGLGGEAAYSALRIPSTASSSTAPGSE